MGRGYESTTFVNGVAPKQNPDAKSCGGRDRGRMFTTSVPVVGSWEGIVRG